MLCFNYIHDNKCVHGKSQFHFRFSDSMFTLGAFFWDYSGDSHFCLGITEYTEYQFPKERCSENGGILVAEVT